MSHSVGKQEDKCPMPGLIQRKGQHVVKSKIGQDAAVLVLKSETDLNILDPETERSIHKRDSDSSKYKARSL